MSEEQAILTACPGAVAEARTEPGTPVDLVWGSHEAMFYCWSGDPKIRFRAATGGVLTSLACHLLECGEVTAILHVGADPQAPMRSRWVISTDTDSVIENSASRYGPTSPLAGLGAALDRREPFAIVAKPCDLGAVHRYAQIDSRVDEFCVARLALVCGGQSRLTKSKAVLDEFSVNESEVTLFRYRGHGNPGATRIETGDGQVFNKSYLEMWGSQAGWDLETRCKMCPDALGETADVAAADAWAGGAPLGEDEGFNAVVVRTRFAKRLVTDARAATRVIVGDAITPRQFDDLQPHQVRKKRALAARLAGMRDAGFAAIETIGLRVEKLGEQLDHVSSNAERIGSAQRMRKVRSDRSHPQTKW